MNAAAKRKLIKKYIKMYSPESDADLVKLYREDFKGKSVRSWDHEEQARKEALEALLMGVEK